MVLVQLVARKVTGDAHIPRGEVSFTADMAPKSSNTGGANPTSQKQTPASSNRLFSASPKSGPQEEQTNNDHSLFSGKGQVARKGFSRSRYTNGRLHLFDDHFRIFMD